MEKLKNNLNFNYSSHRFPDVRLEACSYREYNPSQTDSFTSNGGAALLVVSDGKGVATESERRYTVTKGNGILITGGMTVGIKADSIEPAELIYIKIGGDSVKQLISLIEKRERGILLNFGSNGKNTRFGA